MFKDARLQFIAEDALLVEFGTQLGDMVHERVLALDAALNTSDIASHVETLPTFRSLLIYFDSLHVEHENLLDTLSILGNHSPVLSARGWRVPVCMQGEYAQDMTEAATLLKISEAEIIDRMLSAPLKLYMYGFAPGFAYLGNLDPILHIPRRRTPRAPMPSGALMLAGGLASISSVSMPTGWYVLGQTPVTMFSLQRKALVPFLVGDYLQLYSIEPGEFKDLQSTDDGLAGIERIRT